MLRKGIQPPSIPRGFLYTYLLLAIHVVDLDVRSGHREDLDCAVVAPLEICRHISCLVDIDNTETDASTVVDSGTYI